MQCSICFELITSNYIQFSKCKHQFCPCIYKNNVIQVQCCPLCRSEDLTFFQGQEMYISEYERRCLTCKIRVSSVISKCTRCSEETHWVPINKKYNVITFGIPDIMCISFVGYDRPNCSCCYTHFTKRICLIQGIVYHMFSKKYIKTDIECPFDSEFTLKKCDDITIGPSGNNV